MQEAWPVNLYLKLHIKKCMICWHGNSKDVLYWLVLFGKLIENFLTKNGFVNPVEILVRFGNLVEILVIEGFLGITWKYVMKFNYIILVSSLCCLCVCAVNM